MPAPTTPASCCRVTLSDFPTDCRGTATASLWLLDGDGVDDRNLDRLADAALSATEQTRFAQFIRPQRRKQYLLGRILLREAIGRMARVEPDAIQVTERPGQAPLLTIPGADAPSFSLSHSRRWIACAVSMHVPLGLDIETLDPARDCLALSESAFEPDEHAVVAGLSGSGQTVAFYRLWTMKEALFKLAAITGQPGMSSTALTHEGKYRMQGEDWHCAAVEHPELCISICSSRPISELVVIDAPPPKV
jgi:4'-phosphopantetheinyl transferase